MFEEKLQQIAVIFIKFLVFVQRRKIKYTAHSNLSSLPSLLNYNKKEIPTPDGKQVGILY